MHNLAFVEIVQTLQDLDNIAGDKVFIELPKCLQCLSERPALRIPLARSRQSVVEMQSEIPLLKDDVQKFLGSHHALILDDAWV